MSELTREAAKDQLLADMEIHSRGGPGVEPETAALFGAFLLQHRAENQEQQRPIQEFVNEFAYHTLIRRGIRSAAALSLFRTMQINYLTKRAAERGETFSDLGWVEPRHWREPVHTFGEDWVTDAGVAIGGVKTGMEFRNAATPSESRIVPFDLLSQLVKDRFPEGARGLDIGCSLMVGDLLLMHKDEFPHKFKMDRVTFTAPHRPYPRALTERSNKLVARPPVFSEIVGNDSTAYYYERQHPKPSVYDRGTAEFALAGLRPSERNDPAHMATIRTLMDKKQEGSWSYSRNSGVTFHFGDLLHPEDLAELKETHSGSFDVILMSFLTQELSPEEQLRMHALANELASPNGLIVYLHQAYLQGHESGRPVPYDQVTPYASYATEEWRSAMHVVDKLNPHDSEGLQEMMIFYDNRCKQAKIKHGQLVVNDKLVPISDLIKNS